MSSTETMKEVYLLAQEHSGLKVGDWVRVTRRAESREAGWNNPWISDMDVSIGSLGEVQGFSEWGISVYFKTPIINTWNFPYFVLEKAEKPAHEFKPFDRVLVRDNNHCRWTIDFYSYYIKGCQFPYKTLAGGYCQCIPYKGNEHLIGTTDKPERA